MESCASSEWHRWACCVYSKGVKREKTLLLFVPGHTRRTPNTRPRSRPYVNEWISSLEEEPSRSMKSMIHLFGLHSTRCIISISSHSKSPLIWCKCNTHRPPKLSPLCGIVPKDPKSQIQVQCSNFFANLCQKFPSIPRKEKPIWHAARKTGVEGGST